MYTFKKVRTAVVGCGMISNIYIKNLKNLFHIIDLTAVCDINRAAAEEKAKLYGIEKIMSIDEIAEAEDIELVVNLTGPAAHYDIIKKMLLAGKHVYSEKMLTTDLEKGIELIRIADEQNRYLAVAPDTVLGAGIQTAKRIIEIGMIGEVTSCTVRVNRNQSLNAEICKFLREDGGALAYDVGIYYVAALLTLLGPVEEIRAFGAPARVHEAQFLFENEPETSWKIPGSNILCGVMRFQNGVIGSMHFDGNTTNPSEPDVTVFGTRGILKVGNPGSFNSKVRLILPESGECDLPMTHGYNGVNTLESTSFDGYGHRGVGAAELAYAIRGNRPNRCSKEYGLHCMEVLCGMDIAAVSGETYKPRSRFDMKGLEPGYYSTIFQEDRGDAEWSLIN